MKRNAYIAAALLFAGFTACNNEPAFKVQGEVTDAADKMLYLEQTGFRWYCCAGFSGIRK